MVINSATYRAIKIGERLLLSLYFQSLRYEKPLIVLENSVIPFPAAGVVKGN